MGTHNESKQNHLMLVKVAVPRHNEILKTLDVSRSTLVKDLGNKKANLLSKPRIASKRLHNGEVTLAKCSPGSLIVSSFTNEGPI
jgi:hypothetical protein